MLVKEAGAGSAAAGVVIFLSTGLSNHVISQQLSVSHITGGRTTYFGWGFEGTALLFRFLKNPELVGGFDFATVVVVPVEEPVDIPALEVDFLSLRFEDPTTLFRTGPEDVAGLLILDAEVETFPSPIEGFFAALALAVDPTASSRVLLTPRFRLLAPTGFFVAGPATAFLSPVTVRVVGAFLFSRSCRAFSFSRCWYRVKIWVAKSLCFSDSDLR